MKLFKTDIIIAGLIICITFIIWIFFPSINVGDIALHDTYFVMDRTLIFFTCLGSLSLILYSIRALIAKFNSLNANIGLSIGILISCFLMLSYIIINKSLIDELNSFDKEVLLNVEYHVIKIQNVIAWTWGFFVLFLIIASLLILKTVSLWKKMSGNQRKLI